MLKSSTIKIFAIFATLLFVQGAVLLSIFTRASIRETENSVYEILLLRSQLIAHKVSLELARGKPQDEILKSLNATLYSKTTGVLGPKVLPLDPSDIEMQLENTPSDAFVTQCKSTDLQDVFCAFAPLHSQGLYVLETTPRSSLRSILLSQFQKFLPTSIILLLIALAATWLISFYIQRPLRRITLAAREVAKGNLSSIDLPVDRVDEIGQLARAFHQMTEELKNREKSLTKTGLKLAHQARLASVGQMGASIAHEVKNPLTSMMGYAKHLASKTEDPQLKEAAEIIQKEADRCSQILTQMLRFSRTESQTHKPYALREVVESTLMLIKSELKAARMNVSVEYHHQPIAVGDPQQIQQVLLNLILNAVQACKPIIGERPEAAQIQLSIYEEEGRIRIRLEDHGPGMSKETQLRVFEPFFTTKEKGAGTGLGLSVALDLLQSQGGNLQFESQEGRGTIFWVDLPSPQQMTNTVGEV